MKFWQNLKKYYYSHKYLSEEEIILDVLQRMKPSEKEGMMNVKYDGLIRYNGTAGRKIRDFYGLMHPNNPYVDTKSCYSNNFPTTMSLRIMQKVWVSLMQV